MAALEEQGRALLAAGYRPSRVPSVVERVEGRPPLEALGAVGEELAWIDRDRLAVLARRDELVAGLRAAGVSWDVLAAAAGTTRQALMKRG